jgi:hypothetical protein
MAGWNRGRPFVGNHRWNTRPHGLDPHSGLSIYGSKDRYRPFPEAVSTQGAPGPHTSGGGIRGHNRPLHLARVGYRDEVVSSPLELSQAIPSLLRDHAGLVAGMELPRASQGWLRDEGVPSHPGLIARMKLSRVTQSWSLDWSCPRAT